MARRIVLLRRHEWLRDAFAAGNLAKARPNLDPAFKLKGVRLLESMYPVKVPAWGPSLVSKGDVLKDPFEGALGASYAVAADFEDPEAEARLLREQGDLVESIWSDPQIAAFPTVCPNAPVGTHQQVLAKLGVATAHADNRKGQGVKLAIVDTGIDGNFVNVSGGWSPDPNVAPGMSPRDHGSMVAWDALLAAPNAMVFDYALLKSSGNTWVAFLSDAIQIYAEILKQRLTAPGPTVVVNSWGMYDRRGDAPPGHPQNYSANPSHPFNQIVSAVVGTGADVVFAAGNCGSTCPDGRCGVGDRGPGNSIHGANGHPDVVSVAAVTVNDDLLGYSSEGPAGLHAQKPDVAGFSHFTGSGVYPEDSGTSAACPVVAGVLAMLRSKPSGRTLPSAQLKSVLLRAARAGATPGWNPQTGWGVVDAGAAYAALP